MLYSIDTTSGAAIAAAQRLKVLHLIAQAQHLLYQATQTACPLWDWCDQWEEIGNHADATKALWHRINKAPIPTGTDNA